MTRWVVRLGLVGLLLGSGVLVAHPEAQAAVTAQILNFWRQLAQGGTFSSVLLQFTDLSTAANGYHNFGTTLGASGYGIRDNGGLIEFKNSGGAWGSISGGAPTNATYILQTANGSLSSAQALSTLATAALLNTTGTGVLSAYAGTSCTNQFPRSLSAVLAATCASVNLTSDMTGTLQAANFPALTGDLTTPGGSLATTLANTAVAAGSYGSATAISTFTVDAKGRLTAASTATPQLTLTNTYFSSLSGANLTALNASNLASGTIPAGVFPALTGDVTNTAGSLATTVGKIGGNTVTLGGSLTTAGGNLTLTLTGGTNVTLPTTGTLVNAAVTTLSSLASIGTITTGTWNGTTISAQYGGTGVSLGTQYAVPYFNAANPMQQILACDSGLLNWTSAVSAPTCSNAPIVHGILLDSTTAQFRYGGPNGAGVPATGGDKQSIRKTYHITAVADATATPMFTVTVPNQTQSGFVHIKVFGQLGAGGAVGAGECAAVAQYNIAVARVTNVGTAAVAAAAIGATSACVAGATTITTTAAVSAIVGAVNATQTFTVNGTVTKGGGGSTNHELIVEVDVVNAQNGGLYIS